MASRLNPYISFGGNAREALQHYEDVFGGDLTLSTFGELGAADSPDADKIMHGMLETSGGFTLMGADTPSHMEFSPGNTMAVSLSGDDGDELRGLRRRLDGPQRPAAGLSLNPRPAAGSSPASRPAGRRSSPRSRARPAARA